MGNWFPPPQPMGGTCYPDGNLGCWEGPTHQTTWDGKTWSRTAVPPDQQTWKVRWHVDNWWQCGHANGSFKSDYSGHCQRTPMGQLMMLDNDGQAVALEGDAGDGLLETADIQAEIEFDEELLLEAEADSAIVAEASVSAEVAA
eukprot:tig00020734_g13591.t1